MASGSHFCEVHLVFTCQQATRGIGELFCLLRVLGYHFISWRLKSIICQCSWDGTCKLCALYLAQLMRKTEGNNSSAVVLPNASAITGLSEDSSGSHVQGSIQPPSHL